MELRKQDLDYVVRNIPADVRKLMSEHSSLRVAGGFVRACVAGEKPSDVDLWGNNATTLTNVCANLLAMRAKQNAREIKSSNAHTILTPERMPVQFITRWVHPTAEELIKTFDFTVCQAAVWNEGGEWKSVIGEDFYADLAARRLVYTAPERDEEAGGSMLRVIKYVKRGYSIQAGALAAVMARVYDSVRPESGLPTARVIEGLLREVDPVVILEQVEPGPADGDVYFVE